MYVRLDEDAKMPRRGHWNDAGLDLFPKANLDGIIIPQGLSLVVDTGVSVAIDNYHVGLLFSRSGMGNKGLRFANCVGVIDSGYRGTLKAKIVNEGLNDYILSKDQAIGQLVIVPTDLVDIQPWYGDQKTWEDTNRSIHGFGSTG